MADRRPAQDLLHKLQRDTQSLLSHQSISIDQSSLTFDDWHVIGAASQPVFAGAWINFGGSEESAAFWKDSAGIVRLRGVVKSGTIPSTVFTLPKFYRPTGNRRFACISAGAVSGYVLVDGTGAVSIQAGTNTWVDLSPVVFRAEA